MGFYAVTYSAALLSGYLSAQVGGRKGKPQIFLLILSAAVLVCLLGFREGVGTDYSSIYVDGINQLANNEQSRFELGFALLIKACLVITTDYHLVFFVSAALSVGLAYLAIYRFSDNVIFSIFILLFGGFFAYSTNAVRQMIAFALLLNSIGALKDRNLFAYVIWVAVAASFHTSALFFLVLFPLSKIRIRYFAAVISLVLIWFGGSLLIAFAQPIVSMISPHLASYFSSNSHYFRMGDYDLADLVLCSFGLLLFFFCSIPIWKEECAIGRIYFWIIYCGVAVGLLSGQLFILSRLAIFFTHFAILYIPYCIRACTQRSDRVLISGCYVTILILSFMYLYIIRGMNDILPYESIIF